MNTGGFFYPFLSLLVFALHITHQHQSVWLLEVPKIITFILSSRKQSTCSLDVSTLVIRRRLEFNNTLKGVGVFFVFFLSSYLPVPPPLPHCDVSSCMLAFSTWPIFVDFQQLQEKSRVFLSFPPPYPPLRSSETSPSILWSHSFLFWFPSASSLPASSSSSSVPVWPPSQAERQQTVDPTHLSTAHCICPTIGAPAVLFLVLVPSFVVESIYYCWALAPWWRDFLVLPSLCLVWFVVV